VNDDEEAKNPTPSSPLQKPNHSILHLPFASIPALSLWAAAAAAVVTDS